MMKLSRFGFLLLSVLCLAGVLSGCSATRYGLSEKNWKTLSSAQKKSMRENYHRIASTRAREKREQDRHKITSSTPKLWVEIEGGEAMMPPFEKASAFKPVNLIVYQGHCQSIMLVATKGENKTELEACYLGRVLYLDPSRTEFQWHQGSLQIHYNPIWESDNGFTYNNISSQGYTGLKNTKIRVKQL